jgi:hypothetical protein
MSLFSSFKLTEGVRWKDVIHQLFDKVLRSQVNYRETTVWCDGYTPMRDDLCDGVSYLRDTVKGRPVYYERVWHRNRIQLASYGIIADGLEHGPALQEVLSRYQSVPQQFDFPMGNILIGNDHNFFGHVLRGKGAKRTFLRVSGMKGLHSVRDGELYDLQICSRGLDQSVGLLPAGQYPGINNNRYYSEGYDGGPGGGQSTNPDIQRTYVIPDFFVRDSPLPAGTYPNATYPTGSYWELPSRSGPTRYSKQTSRAYSTNPYDHNSGYGLGVFGICIVKNVIVTGFPIGVNIYGDVNMKGDPEAPNGYIADRCVFENVSVQGCTFGWLFTGGDANQSVIIGCEARNIEGWGFMDNSLLGNHFFGCHVIDANLGAYFVPQASGYGTFTGCYSEEGNLTTGLNRPSRFDGFTTVTGGIFGSGVVYNGPAGGLIGNTGQKLIANDLSANKRLGLGDLFAFFQDSASSWKITGGDFADKLLVILRTNSVIQKGPSTRNNSPAGIAFRNSYEHGYLRGAIKEFNGPIYASTGSADYNYNETMFQVGDTLLNDTYNGHNNRLWVCTQGGKVNGYTENLKVSDLGNYRYQLSGPTNVLATGDWLIINGHATQITQFESSTVFQTTDPALGASNSSITYLNPVFCALERGRGTTAQRPTTLKATDAGWDYWNFENGGKVETWNGTQFI